MTDDARKSRKSVFYRHIHAFRGFAIVNIVAAHALSYQVNLSGGTQASRTVAQFNASVETLFHGSTLYFALISGLLFTLAQRAKGWAAFFRNRLLYVFVPYAVMTLLFTAYGSTLRPRIGLFDGSWSDYPSAVGRSLLFGDAMYQFWYIPVLLLLYLLTPLLTRLVSDPRRRWVIWLLILAPLLASRRPLLSSWTTLVYFMGAYLAGLYIGSDYERIANRFQVRTKALALIVMATTVPIWFAYLYGYEWLGFVSVRESLIYVQKLAMAMLVLMWLRTHESAPPQGLPLFATYAFPIFFLHVLAVQACGELQIKLFPGVHSVPLNAVTGVGVVAVAMAACILVAKTAQRTLGGSSRWVVGV